MGFDVKLEGAGGVLCAIGAAAPLEAVEMVGALQTTSAIVGIACGVIVIIKAGIRVYQLIRDLVRGNKTASEVINELDDVAEDLRAEVRGDETDE